MFMNDEKTVLALAMEDNSFGDITVRSVQHEATNSWSVSMHDSTMFFVTADGSIDHGDRELPAPKPNDKLRLWGRHPTTLGGIIRGIALLDKSGDVAVLYRYRTEEQQDAHFALRSKIENGNNSTNGHRKRKQR